MKEIYSVRHSIFIFLFIFATQLQLFPQDKQNPAREVILQVAWTHQFKFAGYYAALEKGFYKDLGLKVTIRQRSPEHQDQVEEVLTGDAAYGASGADILLQRLQGRPLVVLASIFQHSPRVFISKKKSAINSPQDMIG